MSIIRSQRGANPLTMVFSIALMMGLMAYSMKQMQNEEGNVAAIENAKEAACATQRSQMARDVVMFLIDYPDVQPTTALLEKAGTEIPPCPEKGEYHIYGKTVLCTAHNYEDEFADAEAKMLADQQPKKQLTKAERKAALLAE